DAVAREPLADREGRAGRGPHPRDRPRAGTTAAVALVRPAGDRCRAALPGAQRDRADALVRCRSLPRARPGARDPGQRGRPLDAPAAPCSAARGVPPLVTALPRLPTGAA